MLISAIIPTRNRPQELAIAVESVLAQTRLPDELLVIDQSKDTEGRTRVENIVAGCRNPLRLIYVHDHSISGLVSAKAEGVRFAQGDIVCFLEDDVVLEPGYLSAIEAGFLAQTKMLGCCGIVTNPPQMARGYETAFHLFHRGIFRDPRVGVHGAASRPAGDLVASNCLSGGLSAYRREVFRQIPFDLQNDFFMLEDIDFSTRAAARFGERFFINPAARLEHRMSAVNRAKAGPRQRRKLREYLVFYKKRRHESYALLSVLWLLLGLWLEALRDAASVRRIGPLIGYVQGIQDGLRWQLDPATRP